MALPISFRDQLARDVLLAVVGMAPLYPETQQEAVEFAFSVADTFLAEAARRAEVDERERLRRLSEAAYGGVKPPKEDPKRYAAPDVWQAPGAHGWRPWPPTSALCWTGGPEYDGEVQTLSVSGVYWTGPARNAKWDEAVSWREVE